MSCSPPANQTSWEADFLAFDLKSKYRRGPVLNHETKTRRGWGIDVAVEVSTVVKRLSTSTLDRVENFLPYKSFVSTEKATLRDEENLTCVSNPCRFNMYPPIYPPQSLSVSSTTYDFTTVTNTQTSNRMLSQDTPKTGLLSVYLSTIITEFSFWTTVMSQSKDPGSQLALALV